MRIVSVSVSPLATDIMDGCAISIVLPPNRDMAVLKDMCVRVEGSKKRLARILPSKALVKISPLA